MKTFELFKLINFNAAIFVDKNIDSPKFNQSKNECQISLNAISLPDFKTYLELNNKLNNYFKCNFKIKLQLLEQTFEFAELKKYLSFFCFKDDIKFIDNTIICQNDAVLLPILQFLGLNLTINCSIKNHDQEIIKEVVSNHKFKKKYDFDNYTIVPINLLKHDANKIKVKGKIFDISSRLTKNNNYLITISIVDNNDAITGIYFIDDLNEFVYKINDYVYLYGDYVINKNSKFKTDNIKIVMIEKIDVNNDNQIDDNIPRIELHTHTKMSAMSGVCDVDVLIQRAYDLNYPAIAITDNLVVHEFPAAYKKQKMLNKINPDKQIKVIYGCEMNMVNDNLSIIVNADDRKLNDCQYVIFDLETTGLSPIFNEIIEFGGIKVKSGKIIDKMQLFIKPKKPIPNKISEITHITNEMVENSDSIEIAFNKIKEFIGDSILVAHNAGFDRRFLENVYQMFNYKLTNPIIDTYHLSLCLWPLNKKHTLGAIAKKAYIDYNSEVAHRADYDAEILLNVFNYILNKELDKNIVTLNDLNDYNLKQSAYDKLFNYSVVVLVKNNQGINDLYKLVSISHTETLKNGYSKDGGTPTIYRKQINEFRNNLLIGSSGYNGYLFELAISGSKAELENEINFYDYIEILPLENYLHLIDKRLFNNQDEIINTLQLIIDLANKYNKLIIGSCDVHYVFEEDKIFHEIYINTPGIGGKRHPLYIYDAFKRKNMIYPDRHLKTTKEMLLGYPYLDVDFVYDIVVKNTHIINEQIDFVQPLKNQLFPPKIEGADDKLIELCNRNAKKIYGDPLPEIVKLRLDKELNSIISNNYGVIYYISHLLVKKSNDDGYIVGSRGSVGSSFVATMSNITEVNPLPPHYICPKCQYSEFFINNEVASGYDLENKKCPCCGHDLVGEGQNIPFETFLGFDGDKIPDIDLNFSSDYQQKAHEFTKDVFGEKNILRAGTISTIAEKNAFGHVRNYLETYYDQSQYHEAYVKYLANNCMGVKSSTGQHPGGIVVFPNDIDLTTITPYQYPSNKISKDMRTTHFEYHDIEDNVFKFDILGHVDPTAMRFLCDFGNIKIEDIPLNDTKVISVFNSIEAFNIDPRQSLEKTGVLGLPEFGTSFVRRLLLEANPQTFADLVRISGLSHGTDVWANNAQNLIANGLSLADVIGCRDDIMTYLSSMGIDNKTAFNIMESVRKGKGIKEEWVELMVNHNVPDWYINSAQTIKYLFPKAHAAAYCIMAIRCAWFKVYKPLVFYAQYFSLRGDTSTNDIETYLAGKDAVLDKLNYLNNNKYNNDLSKKELDLIPKLEVAYEMMLRGISFAPIDLYLSDSKYFLPLEDTNQLRIPFSALNGVGEAVIEKLIVERNIHEFISIEDCCKRTGLNSAQINEFKKYNVFNGLNEENQLTLF